MHKLLTLWRSWCGTGRPVPRSSRRPLVLEGLEERCLPASLGHLQLGALPPAPTVVSGDFNGDGRLDAARMSQSGIWQVGLSQGRAFDMTPWGNWGARSKWLDFVVGDFNGDGKDDIAGLNQSGNWIIGLSNGQRFNFQNWGNWGSPSRWSTFVVGDFTGNGVDDIAGLTRQGTWVVGISLGTGFNLGTWAQWQPVGNYAGVWVGDFTGDGRTDVLGLGLNGHWTIGLSSGQSFVTQDWGSFAAGNYAADVEVGDFNGDGMTDVATLSTTGTWTVGVSTGTSFVPSVWAQWGSAGGWDDIAAGDVNGDGKDDLIALGQNGTWVVALSNGQGFGTYTWAYTGQRLPQGLKLQVGDINGDGLADAAVFLPNGLWLGSIASGAGASSLVDLGLWPLGLDQFPYQGDAPPYVDGAPWSATANRAFVTAQPLAELQAMDFNSESTYDTFVENYYGVLHSWVFEADLEGINSDAQLMPFLAAHMQAEFAQTRVLLASAYPGQALQTYQLLMAMNLAHGYFPYAATFHYRGLSLEQTLHLPTGDCTQIANLTLGMVRAEGIPARELGQIYNYPSPQGLFQANHVVVYANGLWLDAEINTAFAINLNTLGAIPPAARLEQLLDNQEVFGFYDWYLQPQVRLDQLAQGQDGGIIAFYYQDYLAGIGQGNTALNFVRGV
jgi:hypothetical protein